MNNNLYGRVSGSQNNSESRKENQGKVIGQSKGLMAASSMINFEKMRLSFK